MEQMNKRFLSFLTFRGNNTYKRLFQNFSFGRATYPKEKIAFVQIITLQEISNFLRKPVPKLTEFWNWLIMSI